MRDLLRLGVVGGGLNSAVGPAHLAAIRMDGAYRLGPCMFSHLEEENHRSHDHYGLPWLGHAANLSEWLDRCCDSLDMVVLLTPSTDHARHIDEIARRGISLLTEKPVACTLSEVSQVDSALAAAQEVEARFVHNYSGYPMFRELVMRHAEGRIGPVHHVRVEMPSDGFARERFTGQPQTWRRNDPEVPMIMLDLGTHMHHLTRMVLGPSEARVHARMHQMVNSLGVIDNVQIWEERADGIQVDYWMSKAHLGVKNGLAIEVYGRDGALIWHQMDPDHLTEVDSNSNRMEVNRGVISGEARRHDRFKAGHPTGFVEALANFYSDLSVDIRATKSGQLGSRWIRPIEDAFDAIRFLDAAARSHHTEEWIET